MRAVEFTTELNGQGMLRIPREVAAGLPSSGPAKIILLTGDSAEDRDWQRAALEHFFRDDAPEDAVYDTLAPAE